MSGGEEWMKEDRVGSREESGESKEERGSRLEGGVEIIRLCQQSS